MTMTKIKSIIPLLVLTVLFSLPYLPMTAQEKKLFTLEDLNYGGTNFRNLQPENKWFSWWGDQLMYLEAEEGGLVDQKGNQQSVFLLKDLGEGWHSAYSAEYPYPQQPLVLLENSRQRVLYKLGNKANHMDSELRRREQNSDWNKQSKAVAYVKDSQLFVRDADNNEHQLTTDGSRNVVYGSAAQKREVRH